MGITTRGSKRHPCLVLDQYMTTKGMACLDVMAYKKNVNENHN
jgi:hypothetical protein